MSEKIEILDWASKNRADPRVEDIKKILGVSDEELDVWNATSSNNIDPKKAFEARDIIVSKVEGKKPREEVGQLESAAYGIGDAASFGFRDEATAALKSVIDLGAGRYKEGESIRDRYRNKLETERAYSQRAQADNPKSYLGGMIGGTIATSLIPGGAALAPAKGLSTLTNMGRAAKGAAVLGAGMSEADLTSLNPEEYAKFGLDTAISGGTGALFQGGLSAAGGVAKALKPDNLREFASRRALKAAGYLSSDTKNMRDLYGRGQELLNRKIVTATRGLAAIGDELERLKDVAGTKIGEIVQSVDDTVKTAKNLIDMDQFLEYLPRKRAAEIGSKVGGATIPTKDEAKQFIDQTFQGSGGRIAKRIREEIIPDLNIPGRKGLLKKFEKKALEYEAEGIQPLKVIGEWKKAVGEDVDWKKYSPKTRKQVTDKLYGIISGEMEDSVAKISQLEQSILKNGNFDDAAMAAAKQRGDELVKSYMDAKQTYGLAREVGDVTKARREATAGLRSLSPYDVALGAAGIMRGDTKADSALQGGLLAAGSMLTRRFGAGMTAVGAQKLAEVISKSPQSLGRFAEIIAAAANNGTNALMATHAALMKDPDYKRILEMESKEKEQNGLPLMPRRK